MKWLKAGIFIALAGLFLAIGGVYGAESVTGNKADTGYWPTREWRVSTPEEQGMDSAKLNELVKHIEDKKNPIDSLIIVRNGYIVTESYFNGSKATDTHQLFSCTKSFTSALIGIAIDDGYLKGPDQKVIDLFPARKIGNINSFKKQLTVKHLLTMTAGFNWNEWSVSYNSSSNPLQQMMNQKDTIQYMLNIPVTGEPGRTFTYNTGASHLLSGIVTKATGLPTWSYAQKKLFEPLGITKPLWWATQDEITFGGSGLFLTARDMAKFGYLYLKKGKWDGKQIIPENWIAESTRQYSEAEAWGRKQGYGYQWWLNSFGGYSARGMGGQYIIVVPKYNLVVVFQSHYTGNDYPPLNYVENQIIPAVQSGNF